jgi:hypothetical protein
VHDGQKVHGHQLHEEEVVLLGHEGGAVVHASWEVLTADALEDALEDGLAADGLGDDDAAAADLDDVAVVYRRSYHLELADVVAATVAVEIAATEAVEVVVESVDFAD